MTPTRETQQMIRYLAASMTPTTLADVVNDLAENHQPNEYQQGMQDFAARHFKRQLVCMVGEQEAATMTS